MSRKIIAWTLVSIATVAWIGYSEYARVTAPITRACLDGVAYLQFPTGVSVQYTSEGKIKTCDRYPPPR